MMQWIDTKVYAARAKDEEILKKSSSGGMFTVLSNYFLDRGYPVACCIYNYDNHELEYHLVFTHEARNKARGSKYVQSNTGNIFNQCVAWLNDNPERELLFVGVGCQTAAFQKFAQMKKVFDRVTLIDIICHGVSSPKLWKDYAESLQAKAKGRIEYVTFKDKRNGWKKPTAFARIKGKEWSIQEYVKLFYNRCALRPSCHHCPYATTVRRTDMTIGDFWGIDIRIPEQYDAMGNSLILIHTDKGERLFEHVKKLMIYYESNIYDCLQPNLEHPTPVSENRDRFWREYSEHGIKYVVQKYGRTSIIRKIVRKVLCILK